MSANFLQHGRITVPVVIFSLLTMCAITGKAQLPVGQPWGWGDNSWGQLGTATTGICDLTRRPCSAIPVPGNIQGLIAVSAGAGYTLGLKTDGTVWAWGINVFGQLGNGSYDPVGDCLPSCPGHTTPSQVIGLQDVVAVSAGSGFSLALKRDGSVWGWGWDEGWRLGRISTGTCSGHPCSLVPVQIMGLPKGRRKNKFTDSV